MPRILVATEEEVLRGRRVRRGEWYRVTTRCEDGVVETRRFRTFRAAWRAVNAGKSSGCWAHIEIYRFLTASE